MDMVVATQFNKLPTSQRTNNSQRLRGEGMVIFD